MVRAVILFRVFVGAVRSDQVEDYPFSVKFDSISIDLDGIFAVALIHNSYGIFHKVIRNVTNLECVGHLSDFNAQTRSLATLEDIT